MTQSILLISVLYALVSVAVTICLAEFVSRAKVRKPGADLGHVACALGSAFLGAAIAARGISLESLFEMAVVLAALVAVSYAGFFLDGAPVDIPLVALAIVIVAALVHGTWSALAGAAGAGAPFLFGAIAPARRTESVRDATVSALGGALLGFGIGVGAAILGAFAAFVAASLRRRSKDDVLAPRFSPYIATALGAAVTASALIAVT